jgi:hypothetical protein
MMTLEAADAGGVSLSHCGAQCIDNAAFAAMWAAGVHRLAVGTECDAARSCLRGAGVKQRVNSHTLG